MKHLLFRPGRLAATFLFFALLIGCGGGDDGGNGGNGGGGAGGILSRTHERKFQSEGLSNLKQMGFAMHNYASASRGQFIPQATLDQNGKPLLSWRVQLLPYLSQQNLYRQFKLNEPWDSPHNKALLKQMPRFYANKASKAGAGMTHYQVVSGRGTPFPAGQRQGVKLTQVAASDGTANTVMIVEAVSAVPWTKPQDISFDPTRPLPKIAGLYKYLNGFNVVMCDGSTKFVKDTVSEPTLRNAITMNDGKPIGPDW